MRIFPFRVLCHRLYEETPSDQRKAGPGNIQREWAAPFDALASYGASDAQIGPEAGAW